MNCKTCEYFDLPQGKINGRQCIALQSNVNKRAINVVPDGIVSYNGTYAILVPDNGFCSLPLFGYKNFQEVPREKYDNVGLGILLTAGMDKKCWDSFSRLFPSLGTLMSALDQDPEIFLKKGKYGAWVSPHTPGIGLTGVKELMRVLDLLGILPENQPLYKDFLAS